jgi:hypothetical protein
MSYKMEPYEFAVTKENIAEYAKGIGHEGSDEEAFPTMCLVIAHRNTLDKLKIDGMPEWASDKMLH